MKNKANTRLFVLLLLLTSMLLTACGGDSADVGYQACIDSGEYWYDSTCNTEARLLSDLDFEDSNLSECVANQALEAEWIYVNEAISLTCFGSEIDSAVGIEQLTALTFLILAFNQLTEIDVSQNTALMYLMVDLNQLTEIDVSKNTALTHLSLGGNELTEIYVDKNLALLDLRLRDNQLIQIDVSQNTALTYLDLQDNPLTQDTIDYLDSIDWIDYIIY